MRHVPTEFWRCRGRVLLSGQFPLRTNFPAGRWWHVWTVPALLLCVGRRRPPPPPRRRGNRGHGIDSRNATAKGAAIVMCRWWAPGPTWVRRGHWGAGLQGAVRKGTGVTLHRPVARGFPIRRPPPPLTPTGRAEVLCHHTRVWIPLLERGEWVCTRSGGRGLRSGSHLIRDKVAGSQPIRPAEATGGRGAALHAPIRGAPATSYPMSGRGAQGSAPL